MSYSTVRHWCWSKQAWNNIQHQAGPQLLPPHSATPNPPSAAFTIPLLPPLHGSHLTPFDLTLHCSLLPFAIG